MLHHDVPPALQQEWQEAWSCFGHGQYTASAVMVRRLLEGTCQENGQSQRTLAHALQALKESGVIDETLSAWASALRALGNEGAHYGKSVDRQDAEDALEFAEALLDHIYVLRRRFEAFQIRLSSRSGEH